MLVPDLSVQKTSIRCMATLMLYESPPRRDSEWDVEVTVLGEPVPWGVGRNPKTGDRFIPNRQAKARGDVMDAYWRQAPARGTLDADESIDLQLRFFIARPKYHYGSGRNAGVIKNRYLDVRPTGRPDLTNLQKLAEDALTGVAWRDDDQVCSVNARKEYTEGTPRTEIRIRFN